MAKTALITGGAGFIGSRLAYAISSDVTKVVVYDNLHPQVHGANPAPPALPDNAFFVRGDVTDARLLRETIVAQVPDLIFHLAAETGTGQSYDEPARYCDVNVMGTTYLIEAVRGLPKDARRRMVLAGSRAVYGEGAYEAGDGRIMVGPIRSPESLARGDFEPTVPGGGRLKPIPTPETLPPEPASVYASTKLMQEFLLSQCAAEGDFEVAVLRFQNVYGPGQSLRNPYTGVLSIFCSQIMDGKRLNIFEDGQIVRDFIYVDDVVSALVAASRVSRPPAAPVNIGSGYAASILECAQTLLELLGSSRDNYTITGAFRPGDVRHAVADISKAKAALGWTPQVGLREGLSALASWARKERDRWATPARG
jgi:dTDP-L-rhamnose 4-epimerase